jgi:osmotically-inducible protein OsmY
VKTVRNEIQVVPASRQAAVEQKDEQIHQAVNDRLGSRDELSDADIAVEVKNGVVRLTGSVASQEDRLQALTTARRGEGVRSVVGDELRVERN